MHQSPAVYDNLKVGAGISTGSVIRGTVGSERRADYTAIGRDVNYGARLSEAAPPGQVLISSATYYAVEGRVKVSGPRKMSFHNTVLPRISGRRDRTCVGD